MTMKELYNNIANQLCNPEFVAKVEEIDAQCVAEQVAGIKFHFQRASNMLQELQSCAEHMRSFYESSFDSSVKDIYKLLEKYE